MAWTRLVLAVVVGAALVAGAPPARAASEPQLVASSDYGQLVVVDTATSAVRDLGAAGRYPAWSPEGDRIAAVRPDGEVDVVEVATGRARLVAVGTDARTVTWSADGRALAFDGEPTTGGLGVVSPDGRDQRPLLTPPPGARDTSPAWSPDGGLIAFVREVDGRRALWVVAPDGTGARRLADGLAQGQDEAFQRNSAPAPVWRPSGTGLLVQLGDDQECCTAALVDLAGDVQLLTGPTDTGRWAGAFSPDGTAVAVGGVELLLIDLASGDRIVLDRGDPSFQRLSPTWSADGEAITFVAHFPNDSGCHCAFASMFVVRRGPDGFGTPASLGVANDGNPRAVASPGRAVRRFGATRVETAARLADDAEHRGTVVVARADLYPDALVGASRGTVLLTGGDRLAPAAADAIRRLGAFEAIVLGSEDALGPAVEQELRELVPRVQRVAGATRYDTAVQVAAMQNAGGQEAFLVQGADPDPRRGWADAISISRTVRASGATLLLTATDALPEVTRDSLRAQDPSRVTIVGGPAAVSPAVEAALVADGHTVRRIAGADRYATSRLVAEEHLARYAGCASRTWFVTGENWPDALAAGSADSECQPLLLTEGRRTEPGAANVSWLADHPEVAGEVRIAGGPDVLVPAVEVQLERRGQPVP